MQLSSWWPSKDTYPVLGHNRSDFHNPPTDAELYTLIPPVPAKQDVEAVNEIRCPDQSQ